jgi:hypothetical protein
VFLAALQVKTGMLSSSFPVLLIGTTVTISVGGCLKDILVG